MLVFLKDSILGMKSLSRDLFTFPNDPIIIQLIFHPFISRPLFLKTNFSKISVSIFFLSSLPAVFDSRSSHSTRLVIFVKTNPADPISSVDVVDNTRSQGSKCYGQ